MRSAFRAAAIVAVTIAAATIAACQQQSAASLRSDLGPYQYIGLDPQLSFSVSKAVFAPGEQTYSSPTLTYTIGVKQNNPKFPLSRYDIMILAVVKDARGVKRATELFNETVENGVLSMSGVDHLYEDSVQHLGAAALAGFSLHVKSYAWSPDMQRKPYMAAK